MKAYYLIPLLFLSACATAPKLALRPQPTSPAADSSSVRYPEVVRAYHLGRYAEPNDDLIMHEQHVVYRVEANTRWDFRPATVGSKALSTSSMSRDAAFVPAPVNDAILAEVNAQRLATVQILMQARTLSAALAQFQSALQQTRTNLQQTAALRATVKHIQARLAALESAKGPPPDISTTNAIRDPLSP